MPVLEALPESSAPGGGPGMRGGASRPRPPLPGMRQCDRHRRRGPRRRARRGKGCWQPLLLEKCLPATGELSPGRSPGNIPRHSVESVGAGSGKSICLSLAMGNMQPFVSLDEVRYSAACHENTGAKWLQRPPPHSGGAGGGGRGAPGLRRALGRAGAGRPRREAGSLRQRGRERGAPQAGRGMPESHVPVPPSRRGHPQISGLAGAP